MADQPKGGSDDGMLMFGMVAVLVIAVGWGLWWAFEEQMVYGVRLLRWAELSLLQPLAGMFAELCVEGTIDGRSVTACGKDVARWTAALSPGSEVDVTWKHTAIASLLAGEFVKWPVALALFVLAAITMFRGPGARFHTRHSLDSLIAAQARAWPVISPFVRYNPARETARSPGSAVPTVLPPFAEALSPEEWIAFNRIELIDHVPDEEAAAQAFARQLGPRWRGPAELPEHLQALFAAFALKGARKRSESDELLGRIAQCYSVEAGLRLTPALKKEIRGLLADPAIGGEAAQVARKHAFRTPALVRVLIWARKRGGVLAPAQFLWLRGQDRSVWYPLNNAGRQSFHPEASGAMAHYMAETKVGRPLLKPKVEAALAALTEYVRTNNVPIPPLEKSTRPAPRRKAA